MPFDRLTFKVSTSDGRHVTFLEEVNFTDKDGTVHTIPLGAQADGASTPWGGWNIFPPFGDYWRAATFHDYLYRGTKLSKEKCDSLFREAMISCHVPRATAEAIYQGVVRFGQAAFDKRREHANV